MSPFGEGPLRIIAITFGMEKLKWRGYPTAKKLDKIHERDRHPDGRTDGHRVYGTGRAYA